MLAAFIISLWREGYELPLVFQILARRSLAPSIF
jgi:hypothetical protein